MFRHVIRTCIGMGLICGLAAVAASAQTFTVLYSFTGGADGGFPYANVIVDHAGNVYGTTYLFGGSGGFGTLFKIDPQGNETTLHVFGTSQPPDDGAGPQTELVEDEAGNLYGAVGGGGANNTGMVFKLDGRGEYSVLYSFPSSGGGPSSGLILDKSGMLYGTTQGGGSGFGTIYQITKEGAETVLYSFRGPTADGAGPCGNLLRTESGALYGTTAVGGAHNFGTVFRLSKEDVNRTLFSFAGGKAAGQNPCSGLVRDVRGNLYGTTPNVPTFPPPTTNGTIFKIARDGTHTVVHAFTGGADGGDPKSGLAIDRAGNLYGTTCSGGAHNAGTVYRLNRRGVLKVLHSFTGSADGSCAVAGVTLDEDGNLYGAAGGGGSAGWGTIFKLTLHHDD